jgi:hypothetical protein
MLPGGREFEQVASDDVAVSDGIPALFDGPPVRVSRGPPLEGCSPVVLILVGGLVLTIVLSVLLPIFDMQSILTR